MKTTSFIIRTLLALSLAYTLLFVMSCRKENPQIDNPEDYIGGNFEEVFETFWNGMNNNYVFWDIDTTDWNDVYKRYKPLFADLNINDSSDVRKGYTYFNEMTQGLVDGHYNISFTSDWLADASIQPSYQRKRKSPDYHQAIRGNHFYYTIPAQYLDKNWSRALVTEGEEQTYAITGTINKDILYLYFNRFKIKETYEADTAFRKTFDLFFERLSDDTQLKGVILDVRSNGGGALADLDFLIGKMINERLDFGFTRSKSNNGRLDYTPWVPAFVTPQKDTKRITCPIVMLADAHSVSMAEITTMAVKALPNGHFVGERTWGGTGPLIGNKFFNGGQYSTSFMKLVYTSSLMLKYKDGKIYEGIGFPPDIEVKYNAKALNDGNDPQLEAALHLIAQR